jgi:hypothetical protein
MLSFTQYRQLNEGIVEVSDSTLDAFSSFFNYVFLNHMKVWLEQNPKNFSENISNQIQDRLDLATRNFKMYLENNTILYYTDTYAGIRVISEKYNLNFTAKLDVILKPGFLPSNVGAAFMNPNTIYVNGLGEKLNSLMYLWFERKDVESLNIALEDKKNDIYHELIHLIEFNIRQNAGAKQKGLKIGYNKTEDGYYTSEIEYETQILTSVKNFETFLKLNKYENGDRPLSTYQANYYLSLLMKKFENDNITLPPFLDKRTNNKFLNSLKSVSPRKFKIAVRKFYIEAQKSIDKLKEQGYII